MNILTAFFKKNLLPFFLVFLKNEAPFQEMIPRKKTLKSRKLSDEN